MDAVEKMVEQILAKGQETTAKHLDKAKKNLHEQLEKDLAEVERAHEENLAKSLRVLEKEHQQHVQRLESLARQEKLSLKQLYLKRLFDEAVTAMNDWPADVTQEFCTKGILAVPDVAGSQVILGQYAKEKLTASWLEAVNAQKKYPLTFAEEVVAKAGGFIVSQGGIEYNFIFESLVQEVQAHDSFAIAEALFQES